MIYDTSISVNLSFKILYGPFQIKYFWWTSHLIDSMHHILYVLVQIYQFRVIILHITCTYKLKCVLFYFFWMNGWMIDGWRSDTDGPSVQLHLIGWLTSFVFILFYLLLENESVLIPKWWKLDCCCVSGPSCWTAGDTATNRSDLSKKF